MDLTAATGERFRIGTCYVGEAARSAGGTTMAVAAAGVTGAGMPANAARYDGPIDVLGTAREIAAARGGIERTAPTAGRDAAATARAP